MYTYTVYTLTSCNTFTYKYIEVRVSIDLSVYWGINPTTKCSKIYNSINDGVLHPVRVGSRRVSLGVARSKRGTETKQQTGNPRGFF